MTIHDLGSAVPAAGLERQREVTEETLFPTGTNVLERTLYLPCPREQVFRFFAQAENLSLVTPPELKFEILSPLPITMRVGTLIDYRIRLHGIPMRWRTRIERWDPPQLFIDSQLKGPYRLWIHHHEFREMGEGTEITDRVWYRLPSLGPMNRLVHAMVRRQLDDIFDYRAEAVQQAFPTELDS